jgi:DNA-binding NarL/FixJ family response regulator
VKSRIRKKKTGIAGPLQKGILLVDDHPLVREGIAALLRATSDLRVTAEAGCAAEALQVLAGAVPDLLLLDLSLPGTSGIELIKDLRVRYPRLPVLVLSMHEESVYAERALRAGANGYIMKQESGRKVLEAIRRVLRGELYVSPALASRLLKLFVSNNKGKDSLCSVERLSDRELQVYTFIGKGLSSQEIADKLQLSIKTIQTYREHIKSKLGLRNAADLAHHATHWVQNEPEPTGGPLP